MSATGEIAKGATSGLAGGVANVLKWGAIIIGIVIVIIIGIALWVHFRRKKESKKADYIEGGGTIRKDFIPGNYARDLYKTIQGTDYWTVIGYNPEKEKVAASFADLTDNELIEVYNYWQKNLYAKDKETMYAAMDSEYYSGTYWNALKGRLVRLGLNKKG